MAAMIYAMIGGKGIAGEPVTLMLDRALLDQRIAIAVSDKPERPRLNGEVIARTVRHQDGPLNALPAAGPAHR
jgi:hypothetical protein